MRPGCGRTPGQNALTESISAVAPGKVVLSGEYAVLDGAPAIAMAVNRFARATVAVGSGAWSRVVTKGLVKSDRRFRPTGEIVEWDRVQDGDPVAVVDAVFTSAEFGYGVPVVIELDSSEFVDQASGQKTGLGSSAAIVVALCAALGKNCSGQEVARSAHRAHRSLQQGIGSGVDVAASLHGGLFCYRLKNRVTDPLLWPPGLHYRLVFSGRATSTRQKLQRLAESDTSPSRTRLLEASTAMAAAWAGQDTWQIIEGYDDYIAKLREFGDDHGLGIFDGGHETVRAIASDSRIVYKPCGAGGGDIGIALATDEDVLENFTRQLRAPFQVMKCKLSETGVSTVSGDSRQ